VPPVITGIVNTEPNNVRSWMTVFKDLFFLLRNYLIAVQDGHVSP